MVTGIFPKQTVPITDTPEQHARMVSCVKGKKILQAILPHITNKTVRHTTQKHFLSKSMDRKGK